MVNGFLYFHRILPCIKMAYNSKNFFFIINNRANLKTPHLKVCAYLSLAAGRTPGGQTAVMFKSLQLQSDFPKFFLLFKNWHFTSKISYNLKLFPHIIKED